MTAHIPTMILVLALTSTLLSISVYAAADRSQREGMMYWAVALIMQTVSYVLINQSSQIGEFPAFLFSAVLRSCAWAALTEGLYEFYRLPAPRRLIWAPVATVFLTFAFLADYPAVRITVISMIVAAQCLLAMSVMWPRHHATPGRGKYFVAIGLAIAMILLLLRAAGAIVGASAALASVTTSSPIQTISILGVLITQMLLSVGFILMSKDRSDDLNRILATQDALTGLANRRRLNEVLANEWARARRADQSLALAMIDIDQFKLYNDHYGHQAGDDCLKLVANNIQLSARRTGDLAARYGGEEFLLILPDADAVVAQRLAEGVRKSIESLNVSHVHSPTGRVTISIGVAALNDGFYKDAESLLRAADQALYRAKELGRNRVQAASESSQTSAIGASASVKLVQLIWHRNYESGNPIIDAQHQNLFHDANMLLSAVLNEHQPQEITLLVDGLIEDISRHFEEEEAILTAAGYPGANEHADLHRALIQKVLQLADHFRAGTLSVGELFEYLAHEIVARHILIADREFFPYFESGHDVQADKPLVTTPCEAASTPRDPILET
jgi:diguanylate cyclase (GGDEF)-like protein/hemerythrin-like metal-binding protein